MQDSRNRKLIAQFVTMSSSAQTTAVEVPLAPDDAHSHGGPSLVDSRPGPKSLITQRSSFVLPAVARAGGEEGQLLPGGVCERQRCDRCRSAAR